MYVENVDMHVA